MTSRPTIAVTIGEPAGIAHRIEAELVARQRLDRVTGPEVAGRHAVTADAQLELVDANRQFSSLGAK